MRSNTVVKPLRSSKTADQARLAEGIVDDLAAKEVAKSISPCPVANGHAQDDVFPIEAAVGVGLAVRADCVRVGIVVLVRVVRTTGTAGVQEQRVGVLCLPYVPCDHDGGDEGQLEALFRTVDGAAEELTPA